MTSLPRIYLSPGCMRGEQVSFGSDELRHIRTVLRLRSGDRILATDGAGAEYRLLLSSSADGLGAVVESREEPLRESPLGITLVQAVPKKELMDLVVQKAVELGVSAIRPVVSMRSVVQLSGERGKKKGARWEKIAAAAVAQSGRTRKPAIGEVCSWREYLREKTEAGRRIILCEGEGRSLLEAAGAGGKPSAVVLAVGPEGGWDRSEKHAAREAGFSTVGLGPRTLRTETAGLAAVSVLQFLYGDLGGEKRRSRVSGKDGETV